MTAETPAGSETSGIPLWLLLFGLSPALLMVLAGGLLKLDGPDSILASVVHVTGLYGGIPILCCWAHWLLRRTTLESPLKILIGGLVVISAWIGNLILAVGACSLIDPPWPGDF